MLRHDMGHSVKRTVETGTEVLWYQCLLENFSQRESNAKALFTIIVVENPHILPFFDDITSLPYFENFQPIISPVNKDFLFDCVNFIVEPLRVSV